MKVGIQLYSVRQNMAKNPMETIRKVVETGYRNIEVANHAAQTDHGVGFGVSAQEMKALLDEVDAKVIGAHIFPLDPLQMEPVLEYHAYIGTKYISMPMGFYHDLDEAKRMAESLNKVGEECKKVGIQLLYHNHFHEFQHFGEKTVMDVLLENTDPELMKLEVDTYWTMRAGIDPLAFLKAQGTRVSLIHQKDFTKGYESTLNLLESVEANKEYVDLDRFERDLDDASFTEIGTGIMDIQSIIDVGNDVCKAEYIVLEQDYSQHDEMESIKISMDHFKTFSGVEW